MNKIVTNMVSLISDLCKVLDKHSAKIVVQDNSIHLIGIDLNVDLNPTKCNEVHIDQECLMNARVGHSIEVYRKRCETLEEELRKSKVDNSMLMNRIHDLEANDNQERRLPNEVFYTTGGEM